MDNDIERLADSFEEGWKGELLLDSIKMERADTKKAKVALPKKLKAIALAGKVKRDIIRVLEEKPEYIFGTDSIYIKVDNFHVAHVLAKQLGIHFIKIKRDDDFSYEGTYRGLKIEIYGLTETPNCKIVARKEWKEVTVYDILCK